LSTTQTNQPDHKLPFDPDGPPIEIQAGRLALAEEARRHLIRKDFLEHCKAFHPDYRVGWVHQDLSLRLTRFYQDLVAGNRPRLMILFPPRHGKSATASILASSWYLGLDPRIKIMNIGYNVDLPLEFSKEVREILRSKAYQNVYPDTQFRTDDRSAESWRTTMGGGFMAAGLQGGITGKGANVIIVDDPLKNSEEADNPMHREKVWQTYSSAVRTRLAPGGGIIIIQTHWNDDDLAGRLKEQNENIKNGLPGTEHIVPFDVVTYQALSDQYEYRDNQTLEIVRTDAPLTEDEIEDYDYTHLRDANQPLHPERYGIEELLELKATLPERTWSALYQQNPVPEGGLYFTSEMFHYMDYLPNVEGSRVVTAWDLAVGTSEEHNYTVGASVQYHHGGKQFLRNVRRFKGTIYRIIQEMIAEARYFMDMDDPPDYRIVIEGGQIWKTMESTFREQWRKAGFPLGMVDVVSPVTDKQVRARPLQLRMEEGTFVFPMQAPFMKYLRPEFMRFPGGKDQDQVDACAWAVRKLDEYGAPRNKDHELPVRDHSGTIVTRSRYKHRSVKEQLAKMKGKRGSWRAA
jgi:hypothetical protein